MARATSTPTVGIGDGTNSVLAGRTLSRLDMIAYGNSVTEGYNAVTESASWVSVLQDAIRTAYGVTGHGIGYRSSYSEVFTDPTKAGTVVDSFTGFGRKGVVMDGTGDSITYTGISGTSFKVWYPNYAGAGAALVEVDGPLNPGHGYVENFATNEYVWCSSVTNCNTVSATGSFSLQAYVTAADWTPSQTTNSICGWQNVVRLALLGVGSGAANKLSVTVIQGGTGKSATTTANWQTSTGWADGSGGWIKADINLATDQVSFYYSNDSVTTARTSVAWTLVQTVALTATITGADSTSSAIIGNNNSASGGGGWLGKIYKAAGLIDGVAAWDMNFATQATGSWFWMDGARRFNSSTLALAGASSSTAKKVVQTDPCGTWLTGYEGPPGILYLNDTSTSVALTPGVHTVLISYAATGTGVIPEVRVSGIQVLDGDESAGIQIINAAHAGYQASHFVADANFAGIITAQVAAVSSPLVFLEFGINEFGNAVPPATYQTYMATFVDAILAGNPTARIVIVAAWESSLGGTYPWAGYVAAMYAVAAGDPGVSVVDFSTAALWPQPGTAAGTASGYYYDSVHPSALGHRAVAGRLFSEVFAAGQTSSTPTVTGSAESFPEAA